ncbi:MAG TPA: thiamine pyrophosphate-binding protein, partial [Labilithrix sp.]|nr:thiamine pyrophosphate-binding protein [Labilithrix sp.]
YAAFEAMGFHRATRRVAGVAVTAGPGATNVVTGVAAAHFERVPMLVLCGEVASDGRRLAQDLDFDGGGGLERLFGGMARAVVRITSAESAVGQVTAAFRAATDPVRPGPAIVVLPIDRADARAVPPRIHAFHSRSRPAAPDPAAVDEVAARLHRAARPLLVIGGGCREHEPALDALVRALGVPFVTTPQAKGLVSELHPLSLRTGGMSASWWARRYCQSNPDVALVLGTDLDDTSTAGTPPVGPSGEVLHVDQDASVFARNFPTTLSAVSDVGAFARALSRRAVRHERGGALARAAKQASPFDEPAFARDGGSPIRPHRVIADLERAAGPRARFVTDIGEHMLFALHYLTARSADRFTIHLGLGSMGSGIASAVGLALGDPSRRVVCICGDGGMQMAGMELLVALQHRLPLVYAVFNDARYNMVYHGYRLTHDREAAWSTPQVDFVEWARSLGAPGRRIERPGEITRAMLDELTAQGPAVLDIRHDPDVRIRGDGRIEALRQMSFGGRA